MADELQRPEHLEQPQPLDSPRRDWFPLGVALALIIFCLTVRGVFHVPLRPEGGNAKDRASTANLADAPDNLTYAAWAQQCRRGDFLMESLYTIQPHRAILFNPYFAAVGLLSRWTGLHVLLVMNLLGLLAAAGAVLVVYRIALALGMGRLAARWACLFLAFGSGLTACQHWLSQPLLGRRLLNGADVVFLDAIGHSTFMVFPYHSVALALAAVVVWMVVLALRPARDGFPPPPRAIYVAAAFVLTLLLSWVHPYEILLPLLAMIAWVVLGQILVVPNDSTKRVRILLCILLALAAAPQVLFGIYLSTQPAWDEFLRNAREVPISARQWIVGFGMLLVLAIIGCRRVMERGVWADAGGWILAWLACAIALLIGLQVRFTKLVDGSSIMMCLLAGCGAAMLWNVTASRKALRVLVIALLIPVFTTPILLLDMYRAYARGGGNPPAVYDPEIATLLGDPNHLTGPRLDVLCDARTGVYLPGLYGYRVFAGNWALTPDLATKTAILEVAGITPPLPPLPPPTTGETQRPQLPPASLEIFQKLLRLHKWDRILLTRTCGAEAFIFGEAGWEQIGSSTHYVLFARAGERPSAP
jgi:hypothetical protein